MNQNTFTERKASPEWLGQQVEQPELGILEVEVFARLVVHHANDGTATTICRIGVQPCRKCSNTPERDG